MATTALAGKPDTKVNRLIEPDNTLETSFPTRFSLTAHVGLVQASSLVSHLVHCTGRKQAISGTTRSITPDTITQTNAMSELSLEEKCKLAAKLVEQSPPGEVK